MGIELKQSLEIQSLIDSESKRDFLNDQLRQASSKTEKDQMIHKIADQEKKRVNSQNEIKKIIKTQDELQKQQTDEEKSHAQIQQQLKDTVEKERLSKIHLQSNTEK